MIMYKELLSRSFSKHDQKKLGMWALVGCFVMVLSSGFAFNSFMGPLPLLNLDLVKAGASYSDILSIMGAGNDDHKVRDHHHNIAVESSSSSSSSSVDYQAAAYSNNTWTKTSSSTTVTAVDTEKDQNEDVVEEIRISKSDHDDDDDDNLVVAPARRSAMPKAMGVICNFTAPKSDYCEISSGSSTRIHSASSTVFVEQQYYYSESDSSYDHKHPQSKYYHNWTLKPYARKGDAGALSQVKQFTVLASTSKPASLLLLPKCTVNHSVPAIVFSTGGYTGNHFHEFTDILVPLYLTSRPFDGEVQFFVADYKSWWVKKFDLLLRALSNYPIINLDADAKEVRCFPNGNVTVGLKAHKEFGIHPLSSSPPHHHRHLYSMTTFTEFIRRRVYSLPRNDVDVEFFNRRKRRRRRKRPRPRLLIVSRKRSRSILNEAEVAKAARKLGFEVEVASGGASMHDLKEFSKKVNSYDVYLGVHGAGLANIVFLPQRAVLIQIVPIGLEWLSKYDFELPSLEMNLRYLEYKVSHKESSLENKYKDPRLINMDLGWDAFKKIYLDRQNVRLDIRRFKPTLLKAMDLVLRPSN